MARSTRKSLAGQAVSAARKVVGGRSPGGSRKSAANGTSATTKKQAPAAKKPAATTKSTATKAARARKAAPATKAAPAKKAAADKKAAPAKKATSIQKATSSATKKAATKTTAATKTAAKRSTTKKTTAKKTTARKTATKTTKKPTKKAPVSALVVKEGESAWTKAELAEVLDELHEQLEHSRAIVSSQENELNGLMRDSGDGAGQDQADLGATSFERDHELTVLNSERDKLAQIERALTRIDNGTYGVCESCGNPIGKMRLMAFPRATLCLTCKQREERR